MALRQQLVSLPFLDWRLEMFERGDVYIMDGAAVRWVGVVVNQDELGNVCAIEMSYAKETGQFIGVDAAAYFNVERPGQRVLLHE